MVFITGIATLIKTPINYFKINKYVNPLYDVLISYYFIGEFFRVYYFRKTKKMLEKGVSFLSCTLSLI